MGGSGGSGAGGQVGGKSADSDAQGLAWPESPGLGLAWAGSGLENLKPKPEPSDRTWPGLA